MRGPAPIEGVWLAPTATRIPGSAAGEVLVTGSHGGVYVGYLAARAAVRALVVHDAGIGRDEAGIGALAHAEAFGMAVVAIGHESARIGDAADMLERGRLSRVNACAASVGCEVGMTCQDAAIALRDAPAPAGEPSAYAEARNEPGTNRHGLRIVCVDSVSLVEPDDAGQIVLSGSHGGVVSGQAALAIKVQAAGAFYNDAGIGRDEAGVSRLPLLDERGIAAATVAAMSARIGDARSTYADGVVSRANETARRLGIEPGMAARDAVERIDG